MMLDIEIDGRTIAVPSGTTVMEAAQQLGIYIPHFCYHKKLSIAANCRMCLVEIDPVTKPLPACATEVAQGMIVKTCSEIAVQAQKGVMEFLLINHPLDCPICDQGGECQLQDLSMAYGNGSSRYHEEKRIVSNKDLGPLITTDMTRCIHCSRCVRFTEEIAGFQELGMAHRGERTEVLPFLRHTVNSEISGNLIDVCPVGALTSKPFRYSARAWELSRRKSISPHDGLGSHLIVQVKNDQVKRVLPLENEAINECWLSDRDRFSYEALHAESRAIQPLIKQEGQWQAVDWETALTWTNTQLQKIITTQGPEQVAAIATPNSTIEELFLLRKWMAAFGVKQVETRLRQSDFRLKTVGVRWLGQSITQLMENDAVLIVGSTLRKEQPLLVQRFRQSVKKGLQLSVINPHYEDWLIPLTSHLLVHPDELANSILSVLKAALQISGKPTPWNIDLSTITTDGTAHTIAASLTNESAVLLGALATHHPSYTEIYTAATALAECTGAKLGIISESANSVGAQWVGADTGGNVFAEPKKAYILLNAEVQFDCYDAAQARSAIESADFVVAFNPFKEGVAEYADVILPIAPFSETAGTFVNMEGRVQSFHPVVRPLGEARPAWKVLHVLGSLLGVNGFDYETAEQIRDEALIGSDMSFPFSNLLEERIKLTYQARSQMQANSLIRLGEIPLYQVDGLTRRAPSLQKTVDAAPPTMKANQSTLAKLDLKVGDKVTVKQGSGTAVLAVELDTGLADHVICIPAGHTETATLGGLFAPITVLKAQKSLKQ